MKTKLKLLIAELRVLGYSDKDIRKKLRRDQLMGKLNVKLIDLEQCIDETIGA